MNQMIETIQGRHQEILSGLNALSRAVVADAGGTHSLQLIGFLRHNLLPHMHSEEHQLYDLVAGLITTQSPSVSAIMAKDHQFVESQIDSIDEYLRTVLLENAQDSERRGARRELETLLAQLNAVLRVHLRREEQVYLMALKHYAKREIGNEIRLSLQRVYGDGKIDNFSTDAAAPGGIS
ncbi:MAG: hemerythrin domain-containing protein [Candidatus Binataceae bacterium]